VKHVSWQELRDVFKLTGCVELRTKGDHLVMTKPGLSRPLIVKMDKDLGEDLIRSNMRTLSLSRKEFERLLKIVRGHSRG